jgi:UDP-GlcNAc:undecaprenyl-phosphate GlcNAc-1-phosphate transferase
VFTGLVFVAAMVVALVLTPVMRAVGHRYGLLDQPDERKIHEVPIPRLGGIGMAVAFAIAIGLAMLYSPDLGALGSVRPNRAPEILAGVAVLLLVGIWDDVRGMRPLVKLLLQIGAATLAWWLGLSIDKLVGPWGTVSVEAISLPLTVLWIVAVINAVNLIDGLDGLAAGVCAISGTTFAIIALSLGRPDAAVLSAIVAGACFGFLRHNFYPARIFMGDSGALLLGFVLATVSIQGLLKTAATVALFIPLFALAVPILDTSFVVARRLKHREKLYLPDQAHLHHRFLRRGFSQRQAVLYLYGWCVILGGAALATRFVPFREGGEWHLWPTVGVALIGFVAVLASLYIVYVLEILKVRRVRAWAERRREAKAEQSKALSA